MTVSRNRRWPLAATVLLTLPLFGFDRGCIKSPSTDSIVTISTVTVRGTISRYDDQTGNFIDNVAGSARIRINGGAYTPWTSTNSNEDWVLSGLTLNPGVNTLDGQTWSSGYGTIDPFILELKDDLPNRGTQLVYLDFSDPAVDTQLEAIASGTLQGPLTPGELDQFVSDVKTEIRKFFASAYSGTSVSLTNAPGADVHTVVFQGKDSCDLYGSSPIDYENKTKGQTSNIFVGTFKCTMVDDDGLLENTPAELTDTLAMRVKDVGTAIGRTAAHEVGHSLGLTAENNSRLHGCEGSHNCKAYDDSQPSDRFDNGHHIMDPGPRSLLHARIGQSNMTQRSSKLPRFETYGRSYLRIIHP